MPSANYDYDVLENGAGSQEDYVIATQKAINGGVAWKFQGSVGRSMMAALEAGACVLGRKPAADYYGNRIPSRDEVKPGTKGSVLYVAQRNGQNYADFIASI